MQSEKAMAEGSRMDEREIRTETEEQETEAETKETFCADSADRESGAADGRELREDRGKKDRKPRKKTAGKNAKTNKWLDIITTAVIVIALGIFLFSGYRLYSTWKEYRQGTRQYEDLADRFPSLAQPAETPAESSARPSGDAETDSSVPSGEDETGETNETEGVRDWVAFYQEMKAMNPDYVGWIVIEDTPINYPIVQAEDNDYYLHRLFDGTENFSGTLFVDYLVRDCFGTGNTILYGHNMKNGSMFAGLLKYREEWFYQSHKTFSVYTEEGEIVYEVFAIYVTAPVSTSYTVGFSSDEEYIAWLNAMYDQSVVKPDVEFDADTSVLTLSTCVNDSKDRLIIQARRITP